MALITAHLYAEIILVVTGSDRYIISLFPPASIPPHPPPLSPSLISLMVSVDVKHPVYWDWDFVPHNYKTLKWLPSLPTLMQKSFWWWQCNDRYRLSPPPTPHPHISLMVSMDVKHPVYWDWDFVPHNYKTLKWLPSLPTLMQKSFWWWQCNDRYRPLPPPNPPPSHPHISLMVSMDVKHHVYLLTYYWDCQNSGAMWKSRWPSWASVPNKPTVSVDVKQLSQPSWDCSKRRRATNQGQQLGWDVDVTDCRT